MAVTEHQKSDNEVIETYKKSWDAFLDTYLMLSNKTTQLETLVRNILRTLKVDALETLNFRARYEEITGSKYIDARDKEF